ncbi:MAG: MFS transporter [Chthonomonadales bacterium]
MRQSDARPPELNRLEVLRALRISNWEAVTSTAHFTLTSGAFQTGFALWLGASNFWMGVLGAIPTLAGLVQLVSSYIVEQRGERKLFTAWSSLLGRMLWLPILLVPVWLPPGLRMPAFFVLFTLSSILLSIPVPAFMSWMSDLVPPDHRGRYFGKRNMLAGITVMVVSVPAAWFLDLATKRHTLPEWIGFGTLFGLACLFGVASFVLLLKQAEPPMQRSSEVGPAGLLAFYRAPLADTGFRSLMIFSMLFAAAQFFAAPFYTVYALDVLKLDYVWLQVLGAVASLASLASMPVWGYLSDKFGSKPLLAISVFGTGVLPLPWVVSVREHPQLTLVLLLINNALGGFFWAGVGLTQFNLIIGTTPTERKSVYIGTISAVTAISGGLAPVVGGIIVTALEPVHLRFLGLPIGNYQLVFALNSLLRYLALLTLRPVSEPGASTAREALTHISGSQMGALLAIRRLQSARNEAERRQAIQMLGGGKNVLALDELIEALTDASLHVRERAAIALGELGDERAVPALIQAAGDPATGITEAAAEALGRIGDERAVPVLAAMLQKGGEAEAVAAARALGRIGTRSAADALTQYLKDLPKERIGYTASAAVAALGETGDKRALPVLMNLVSGTPRCVMLSAIRALGKVGDMEAVPVLLTVVEEEEDPAILTHASVALGTLGAREAVGPLLRRLATAADTLARRQIAYAIGTIIQAGEGLYTALTADHFARDEAVAKLLRGLTRVPGTNREDFGARRRSRQFDHMLEKYLAGDYSGALRLLERMLPEEGQSGTDAGALEVVRWGVEEAKRRNVSVEEALLVLFGFARLKTAG